MGLGMCVHVCVNHLLMPRHIHRTVTERELHTAVRTSCSFHFLTRSLRVFSPGGECSYEYNPWLMALHSTLARMYVWASHGNQPFFVAFVTFGSILFKGHRQWLFGSNSSDLSLDLHAFWRRVFARISVFLMLFIWRFRMRRHSVLFAFWIVCLLTKCMFALYADRIEVTN